VLLTDADQAGGMVGWLLRVVTRGDIITAMMIIRIDGRTPASAVGHRRLVGL
jgi:hypothetical protein